MKVRTFIKMISFYSIYPFFKLFPIQSNSVLINCDNGKNFSGNPRAIFNKLVNGNDKYKFIVTKNANNKSFFLNKSENIKFVKYMSLSYLWYLAVSKYWVVNINLYSRSIPRKNQIYLQTWHGTPLKKIGIDIIDDKRLKEKREWMLDAKNWSFFISNSINSNNNYKSAFNVPDEKLLAYGLPRNDKLGGNTQLYKRFREVRNIYKKKVILYAPTYRDDGSKILFNFAEFSRLLGDDYFLLVNFHRLYKYESNSNFYSVEFNTQLSIEECMEVSDLLITDYSSIFFDYSMLNKPIIFYPYDYDKYRNEDRGMYYDYKEFVPGPIAYNFDQLKDILNSNLDILNLKMFSKEFNQNYDCRDATSKIIAKVFYKE